MIEHGFPAKLIRLTLDGSKSSVRVADEISSYFVTFDGQKQGDALSNLLFNIALEGAIRRAGVHRSGALVTMGFADDIDIIGIDRRAVEEVVTCYMVACDKVFYPITMEWRSTHQNENKC